MINREELLNDIAEFTWMFDKEFFVETDNHGNWVWNDPEYGGDNTLTKFNGDYAEFCQGNDGRTKGFHTISYYISKNVIIKED